MNKLLENAELSAVINTMVDGVILIDETGIIRLYNPACVKIFGYSREEAMNQSVNLLMPDTDRERHDGYIRKYQTSGQGNIIGIGREVKGRRKNGEVFPMYLSVGDYNGDGKRSYIGIIRDLTMEVERKDEFDRLQQAHFHLSRVNAMDQMGAAIAHELNQPLTAIMNYLEAAQVILGRSDPDQVERVKDIMQKSAEQAHRAAEILGRLRQFIETGDVEKHTVGIADILDPSIELVMPSFRKDGVEIEVNIARNLPDVYVNDVQIQQVLVNLIRNGCEAMAGSEIKQLRVDVSTPEPKTVCVSISDTGPGLEPGDYESMFEPFNSTKAGGLGVGLSISRTIINNHNGRLWAEACSPTGTMFSFTLPVEPD